MAVIAAAVGCGTEIGTAQLGASADEAVAGAPVAGAMPAPAVSPRGVVRVRGADDRPLDAPAARDAMVGQQPIGAQVTSPISYHGGPVIRGTANLYYIWYGDWSASSAPAILTDLARNLGGSPYFNINATYADVNGPVSGNVQYAGSTSFGYTYGRALNDGNIAGIVTDAIDQNRLPYDANGVYLVLTAADVDETTGMCSHYCAWHTSSHLNWFGGPVDRFGFVGNPARCPALCAAQTTSPNGDYVADAMASALTHELEETVTDPDGNAWYDGDVPAKENADKCAWNFGPTYTLPNGASANMRLGARDYLIQQNWINQPGGGCGLQLDGGIYFTHVASGPSIVANSTYIDNPKSNGAPNALLWVTPNWNTNGGSGVYDNHPVGVWYDSSAAKWAIFNEDGAAMPAGAAFNVRIGGGFRHQATASNSAGDYTVVDYPLANGNPNADLHVTPSYNPGFVYDRSPIGVFYIAWQGRWAIFNQDLSPIPGGASFNVRVEASTVFRATTANISNHIAEIIDPRTDNNPGATLFVTANWNPGGAGGTYDGSPLGVYYNPGSNRWTVFNQNISPMPVGAAFNLVVH